MSFDFTPSRKKVVPYELQKLKYNTQMPYAPKVGDIVAFQGTDTEGKSDELIRKFTNSRWTHVGIVACFMGGKPKILETTVQKPKNALIDYYSGKKKTSGVMLVDLWDRVRTYKGTTWIRPLNRACDFGSTIFVYGKSQKDVPFEKDITEFVQAVVGFVVPFFGDPYKAKFCSEFLHDFFLGIKWTQGKSALWVPKHFIQRNIGSPDGKYFYEKRVIKLGGG